jgi:DNA-binding transcriptional regulator YiaG
VAPFPSFSTYRRVKGKVEEVPETLGEHLRQKRVDLGLTKVQMAQIFGVAYQTIERWEHNRTLISSKNRMKVLAFLDNCPNASLHCPSR